MPLPTFDLDSPSLDNPLLRAQNGIYTHHGAPFAVTLRYADEAELPDLTVMDGLRQLDITRTWVYRLPPMPALTHLYADHASLGALPDIPQAQVIYADGNRIEALPEDVSGWSGLRVLSLYQNNLRRAPDALGDLTGLEHLSIGGNSMVMLLPESLWNLTNLRSLNIAHNTIGRLSDGIGRLQRLEMFDAAHNYFTELPAGLLELRDFSGFLYLGHNMLTSISSEFFTALKKTCYLNLTDSAFGTLPESLGEMTGLRELRLYNAALTALPESIGNLVNLRELHLMDNRITALPATIDGLTALHTLDLRNNYLMSLPESLGRLPRLRQLDLRNNRLTVLPDSLAGLPALEKLDVRWNKLTPPPAWSDSVRERGGLVYT